MQLEEFFWYRYIRFEPIRVGAARITKNAIYGLGVHPENAEYVIWFPKTNEQVQCNQEDVEGLIKGSRAFNGKIQGTPVASGVKLDVLTRRRSHVAAGSGVSIPSPYQDNRVKPKDESPSQESADGGGTLKDRLMRAMQKYGREELKYCYLILAACSDETEQSMAAVSKLVISTVEETREMCAMLGVNDRMLRTTSARSAIFLPDAIPLDECKTEGLQLIAIEGRPPSEEARIGFTRRAVEKIIDITYAYTETSEPKNWAITKHTIENIENLPNRAPIRPNHVSQALYAIHYSGMKKMSASIDSMCARYVDIQDLNAELVRQMTERMGGHTGSGVDYIMSGRHCMYAIEEAKYATDIERFKRSMENTVVDLISKEDYKQKYEMKAGVAIKRFTQYAVLVTSRPLESFEKNTFGLAPLFIETPLTTEDYNNVRDSIDDEIVEDFENTADTGRIERNREGLQRLVDKFWKGYYSSNEFLIGMHEDVKGSIISRKVKKTDHAAYEKGLLAYNEFELGDYFDNVVERLVNERLNLGEVGKGEEPKFEYQITRNGQIPNDPTLNTKETPYPLEMRPLTGRTVVAGMTVVPPSLELQELMERVVPLLGNKVKFKLPYLMWGEGPSTFMMQSQVTTMQVLSINLDQLRQHYGKADETVVGSAITHELAHYCLDNVVRQSDKRAFRREIAKSRVHHEQTTAAGSSYPYHHEQFAMLCEFGVWKTCCRGLQSTRGHQIVGKYFDLQHITADLIEDYP